MPLVIFLSLSVCVCVCVDSFAFMLLALCCSSQCHACASLSLCQLSSCTSHSQTPLFFAHILLARYYSRQLVFSSVELNSANDKTRSDAISPTKSIAPADVHTQHAHNTDNERHSELNQPVQVRSRTAPSAGETDKSSQNTSVKSSQVSSRTSNQSNQLGAQSNHGTPQSASQANQAVMLSPRFVTDPLALANITLAVEKHSPQSFTTVSFNSITWLYVVVTVLVPYH